MKRLEGEEDLSKNRLESSFDNLFEELSNTSGTSKDLNMISMLEKHLILRALQKTKGNQVKAALLLGINRITLRGKMEKYHIKKEVLVSEKRN